MGRSVVEICGHHLHTEPDKPSVRLGRPFVTKLEPILLACLAKAPENRPRDAQELLTLLAECEGETRWNNGQAKDWWLRWRARKEPPEQSGPPRPATDSRDVA
jgi:hypothetical protein